MSNNNVNWIKLTREDGTMLLRAYLYSHARELGDTFEESGDKWQAFLWNQTVEAVLAAPTITDLMPLSRRVTGSVRPEWDVLEALCSYREDEFKHVERQYLMAGGEDDG